MYNEISDSLSSNLSSIQLNLFDFGSDNAKENVVKRALNQSLIKDMNEKLSNLDDNHFEYVNPVCPHCIKENMRGSIIKKGFRPRKIRINGNEKLNPYDKNKEKEIIKQTIESINVSTVLNTLNDFDEKIEVNYIHNFINEVKYYDVQDDKNITVYLRKYKCKRCKKHFQTELTNVYDKYKRYAKSFFNKIDEITSYSHYTPSQLQDVLKTSFNREINLKTLFDWTRTASKISRSNDYDGITYNSDENLILNLKEIGSGIYNYDEQYLSENKKDGLRLTLSDAKLKIPIAEQIIKRNTIHKWKITKEEVSNFIKKATKDRAFHVLITDGRAMYKKIAKEFNVEHQLCIFHAIYNNKNDAKNECKSLSKSTLDKMTIFNYTSQINEIVRQLSLEDAKEQLNELKEIQSTIGLPKINKKMLERTEKNFYQLTTHLRLNRVPRTNNNAELTYNLSLQKSEKRKYKTEEGIISKLITYMKNKTLQKVTAMY